MAKRAMGLLAGTLLCAAIHAQTTDSARAIAAASAQPEGASGIRQNPGWHYKRQAVAAANPLATQAGHAILAAGGGAVDAAIAVQMVLTLVEPQSSGIGGGAFLMHFDGKSVQAYDGRETAPAEAGPHLVLGTDGKPMALKQATVGGRAVGVPGVLRMLAMAHAAHGKLPWAVLFRPAIALAEDGFAISPRLASLLANETALQQDPVAAAYFYDPQGRPWPAGHLLRNPELAAVLQRIAAEGPNALMEGEIAQAIVDKVRQHASNPGLLQLGDLANYRPVQRQALCINYSVPPKRYHLCGMPPPSSGMLTIASILGTLDFTEAANLPLLDGQPSAQWLHLYSEAARLAFADRAAYVADPAFADAPAGDWKSLIRPPYLQERAKAIAPDGPVMPQVQAGRPDAQPQTPLTFAPMAEQTEHGTSHISVVDRWGHAVAMTTTIEDAFGARLMVNRGRGLPGGFLLNNQLTDFSFAPTGDDGKPVANRVQPGKRPRSSMAPTLVFDADRGGLRLSGGSPGGAFIIHFTAKTLYGVMHWALNPQEAIDLPNFASMDGYTLLEKGRFSPATLDTLKERGHKLVEMPLTSGLQVIARDADGLVGGADGRREGVVLGD
jgi:gamma-glutamyltranspeptidase/glutathione hydrolase